MSLTSYDPTLAEKAMASPPTVVPFAQIESILSNLLSSKNGINSLLDCQRLAFQKSTIQCTEEGLASSLPIQTAGQPPQPSLRAGLGAQVCIKTGYIKNGDTMVSKVAAGGGNETGNTGVVFVFDQLSLRLKTVLCDEGLLTEVRTAAACAYASRLLLGDRAQEIQKVGIVGGGVQACWQLRLLAAGVLPESCRTVVIKTQSKKSAEEFIHRMNTSTYLLDRIWKFEHYSSGGEAFKKCQLIHTMTPSRTPVLDVRDVTIPSSGESNFLHITAVGADCFGKKELDPELVDRADLLVCDSIPQSLERGEFQGLVTRRNNLVEIGAMENNGPHRYATSSDQCGGGFSIFDSSGLALQDVEMATLMVSQIMVAATGSSSLKE